MFYHLKLLETVINKDMASFTFISSKKFEVDQHSLIAPVRQIT